MSLLGNIIGVNVGDLLTTGVGAAVQIFSQNSALQIAQLNLQAQQTQTAAVAAAEASDAGQIRLIVTGGLVLAGAVLAVRALRK